MSVELVTPSERYRASFLAGQQELIASGADAPKVVVEATFAGMLVDIAAAKTREVTATRVPSTTLWLVDGDEFIGRISIRHVLSEALRRLGGHIGYDVRPSRRGQGYGIRMLRLAKPHAKALGIDPAMLTCDAANEASWRMIERAGGMRCEELVHDGIRRFRYLLPTTEHSRSK
jgi:predicted acetyltransferase